MRRFISLLSLLLLSALPVRAQKQYVQEQQLWLGVFNQTRFSPRWGTWTDLHLRTHGLLDLPSPYGRIYVSLAHDDEAFGLMRAAVAAAAQAMH